MSVLSHRVDGCAAWEPQQLYATATRVTPFCAYTTLASVPRSEELSANSEPAGKGELAGAAEAGADDASIDGTGRSGIADGGSSSDGAALEEGAGSDAGMPAWTDGLLPHPTNATARPTAHTTRSFTTIPRRAAPWIGWSGLRCC